MKNTDKARIDWLERNKALLDASCFGGKDSIVVIQVDHGAAADKTIRGAIDAAMDGAQERSR